MVGGTKNLKDLQLVGGRPCLDFVNTEGDVRNGPPERIESYESLVAWSVLVGLLDEKAAARLVRQGSGSRSAGAAVFRRAISLREALFRIFVATMDGQEPASEDRAVLDGELVSSLAHQRLVPADGTWRWEFVAEEELDSMLWTLARDAAELLTSRDLDRVRECSGKNCTWLFMDRSRNRSRRWCDMADCGNRSKARRYYQKQKADA